MVNTFIQELKANKTEDSLLVNFISLTKEWHSSTIGSLLNLTKSQMRHKSVHQPNMVLLTKSICSQICTPIQNDKESKEEQLGWSCRENAHPENLTLSGHWGKHAFPGGGLLPIPVVVAISVVVPVPVVVAAISIPTVVAVSTCFITVATSFPTVVISVPVVSVSSSAT